MNGLFRNLSCIVGIVMGANLSFATVLHAEPLALIVNADSDFGDDRDQMFARVKRLYLKKQSDWPGGVTATPFARPHDSAEEMAFRRVVLKMSEAELESFWLRIKQTKGDTPPRGIGSTRILMRQVSKRPGAFGVVSLTEAQANSDVAVLFEFEGTPDE